MRVYFLFLLGGGCFAFTLLRLNGFPLCKVDSNVVFLCLCLYMIEERRHKEGRSLREIICPGSVAYWAWFDWVIWGEGHHFQTTYHPTVGITLEILRSALDKQVGPVRSTFF